MPTGQYERKKKETGRRAAFRYFGIDNKGKPRSEWECLHHLNTLLREKDPERYNQWRPEDLVVMKLSDHQRLHSQLRKEQNPDCFVKLSLSARASVRKSNKDRWNPEIYGEEYVEQRRQHNIAASKQQKKSPKWIEQIKNNNHGEKISAGLKQHFEKNPKKPLSKETKEKIRNSLKLYYQKKDKKCQAENM